MSHITSKRVVIQFLVKAEINPYKSSKNCRWCMETSARVFKWTKRFKEGWESVEDNRREGAPITSRTDTNFDRLHALIMSDQHLSIRALCLTS